MTGRPACDALALHEDDDVATALRALSPGETARVRRGADAFEVAVAEPVPLCHKLALRALAPGEGVRKYGEVIGEMTSAVAQGGLVHVHNMASRRARRRAEGERRHAG
jgi:SAF domain